MIPFELMILWGGNLHAPYVSPISRMDAAPSRKPTITRRLKASLNTNALAADVNTIDKTVSKALRRPSPVTERGIPIRKREMKSITRATKTAG